MAIGSYTRAQTRAKLQAKLDSSPFWTDTEANNALNEAIAIYGLLTGMWKTRKTAATTGDDGRIYLDTAILRPIRISRAGVPLMQATLNEIDNSRPGWEGETTATGGGVPTEVAAWIPMHWTVNGTTVQAKIGIWPNYAAGGTTLTVDGIAAPPVLANDVDEVEIDDADLEAILARALIALSFKKPGALAGLKGWQDEFQQAVATRNSRLAASDQFKAVFGNPMDANRPMKAVNGDA